MSGERRLREPDDPAPRRLARAHRALRGAAIGLAAALVALAAAQLPFLDTAERRTLDARMKAFADARRADRRIVAVDIDQASLDALAAPRERGGLGQGWPWPRDLHAAVVRYLLDAGARAIAFDLIFSEPSVYSRLGVTDDDGLLAASTADRLVVQGALFSRAATGANGTADVAWPEGLRDDRHRGVIAGIPADAFNKATLPIAPLRRAAVALGSTNLELDADGRARTLRPVIAYAPAGSADGIKIWSLPLAVAAVVGAKVESGGESGPLTVEGREVPLDGDGRLIVRFYGDEHVYPRFSFADVLAAARRTAGGETAIVARPEDFQDRIVFFGASAPALNDVHATSAGAALPRYAIHAAALDNFLNGGALSRPIGTRAVMTALVGLLTGVLVALARRLRVSVNIAAALLLGYVITTLWAFSARGLWLDVVAAALAVTGAWAGASVYGYLTEGRERRYLTAEFSRYLEPDLVKGLVVAPERLALEGETREVTVMVANVGGLTGLADDRAPEEAVALINEVFSVMSDIVGRHGGTADKLVGDALMAFWNAPVEQPNHARRAVRAARELLLASARLDADWKSRGLPHLAVRLGIASGSAVAGNVGSRRQFNYTVLGGTAKLASRLEATAEAYSTTNLIAGATVEAAGGAVSVRELDWVQLQGRSVPVFELVLDDATDERVESQRVFAEGLRAYRERRFAAAAGWFEAAITKRPDDGPAHAMLLRARDFMDHPPPTDWEGAHAPLRK